MRATLSGTNPTLVASDLAISSSNPLASNGVYVVWTAASTAASGSPPNGAIKRVHAGDNDVVSLAPTAGSGIAIMDAAHVYWSDDVVGTLHEMGLDGSMPHVVATAGGVVFGMAIDSTNLYFAHSGGTLAFTNLSTGTTVQVTPTAPRFAANFLAADANNLYVWSYNDSSVNFSDLLRVPKNLQGDLAVLASKLPTVAFGSALATDDAFVYFAHDDGIYRVQKAGGTAVRIAPAPVRPSRLIVSGGAAYWITPEMVGDDGAVMRLAVFPN
jgi:hypothetical protein